MLVIDFISTMQIAGSYVISLVGATDGVEYMWANNYTGLQKILDVLDDEKLVTFKLSQANNKLNITIYFQQED